MLPVQPTDLLPGESRGSWRLQFGLLPPRITETHGLTLPEGRIRSSCLWGSENHFVTPPLVLYSHNPRVARLGGFRFERSLFGTRTPAPAYPEPWVRPAIPPRESA